MESSGPAGTIAILLVSLCLPSSQYLNLTSRLRIKFSKASLSRIDIFGVFLLLAASVLLVFALEEGGARFSWGSAVIISTIVLAGIGWVSFVGWEYFVDKSASLQEPIFPLSSRTAY